MSSEANRPRKKPGRGGPRYWVPFQIDLLLSGYKNASIDRFPLAKNELILSP